MLRPENTRGNICVARNMAVVAGRGCGNGASRSSGEEPECIEKVAVGSVGSSMLKVGAVLSRRLGW